MTRRMKISEGVRPAADEPAEATFGVLADEFADAPSAERMIRELRGQDVAAGERRNRSMAHDEEVAVVDL